MSMYKTVYQSTSRVVTLEEALKVDIPLDATELFLWLIDVYDLAMKGIKSKALALKIKAFLIKHYKRLHVPIPGCLLGWTHSMFVFIVYLNLHQPTYTFSQDYVKRHCLRLYTDPNPLTWSWDTYASTLDLLALKWNTLDQSDDLQQFLEMLWSLARRFCLFIHTKDILSVDIHTHNVAKTKYHVRLSPEAIVSILSRFVGFQFHNYKLVSIELPENNVDYFISMEKRHLVTRKFRENLLKWIWDKVILIGDKDIASHDQLGENVSSYTCLFKRFPAGQLTQWQRLITYANYEDIQGDMREYLHLHFIDQHFQSVYNVGFIKYFVVFDVLKHKHNIAQCQVPLILYLQGKYHTHWSGVVYECNTITNAFVHWLTLIKKYCHGKPYNMDFNLLIDQIFESMSDEETLEGYYTLHDEDL